MTVRRRATVSYKTHQAYIDWDQERDIIYVFKHDDRHCDWQIYTVEEESLAAEFMIQSLPQGTWRFEPDEEDD